VAISERILSFVDNITSGSPAAKTLRNVIFYYQLNQTHFIIGGLVLDVEVIFNKSSFSAILTSRTLFLTLVLLTSSTNLLLHQVLLVQYYPFYMIQPLGHLLRYMYE